MRLRIASGLVLSGLLHLAIVMAMPDWQQTPTVAIPDNQPIHLDISPALASHAVQPVAPAGSTSKASTIGARETPSTRPDEPVDPVDRAPRESIEANKTRRPTGESKPQPERPDHDEAIAATAPVPKPKPVKTPTPKPVMMAVEKAVKRKAAAAAPPSPVAATKPERQARQPAAPSSAVKASRRQAYLAQLVDRIQRQKRYPKAARRRGEQGIVELFFMVQPDGQLTGIRVEKSSGSDRLDRAAVKTLQRVSPVDPLPELLGRRALSVQVPIAYRLRG